MARIRVLVPALVAIGLAVGCGGDKPTAVSPDLTNLTTPGVTPGQQYQAPGGTGGIDPVAAVPALQKDVLAAFQQLKGYSGNIETIDIENGAGKKVVSKADVKFMKPEWVAVHLTYNSEEPAKAGTKAVWKGGEKIKVKPSGLLGFAKVDLSTGDKRLLTLNGWKINQFSLKTNVESLTHPQAKVKYLGRSQLGSYTLALADVSGSLKVQNCDHVKLGIDINTKLPVYAEFMSGTKLYYSMRLLNVSMSAPSPSDFEL